MRIELTDFSVYYTQGATEAAAASLKSGKSQVVCEQGQIIKISKDKDGVVTREKLTCHWTDWVDYWAVDFDYMSRREIIKVAKNLGLDVGCAPRTPDDAPMPALVRTAHPTDVEQVEFEERRTGSYISRTSGEASAPARPASWSLSPRHTPTPEPAATPWPSK